MPLTPADVHNVAFKKPPIGKRGYDEDEVDAFLDLVEAELARLIEENNDLKAQVDEFQSKPPGPMQHSAPPPPPVGVAAMPPTMYYAVLRGFLLLLELSRLDLFRQFRK